MINALRLVSVQRGYDPRDFVLVPFGGAGGVHANRLAAELQIPLTIVPPAPGVFSAFGLLVTDLKHEYSTTRIRRTDQLDVSEISGVFSTMADQGRTLLLREGVADEVMSFPRHLDMRYVGQSWELSIPFTGGYARINRRLIVRSGNSTTNTSAHMDIARLALQPSSST